MEASIISQGDTQNGVETDICTISRYFGGLDTRQQALVPRASCNFGMISIEVNPPPKSQNPKKDNIIIEALIAPKYDFWGKK